MPTLLLDILKHVVGSAPDMMIVGQIADFDLAAAAKRMRADVLVVGDDAGHSPREYAQILLSRPGLKVLAITDDGKNGTLYEMRPHYIPLGEISADTLRDAVRGRYGREAEIAAEEGGAHARSSSR